MSQTLQHRLFITTIALTMILIFLDQNGMGVTLSPIQDAFHISNTLLQWVMSSMLVAVAASVLIAGKLGDLFGSKRMFLLGMGLFIIASAICGAAPNITGLLIGRALQGLSGSLILSNYIVLIHHQYGPIEQPKVLGLCLSISAMFGAGAPAFAGFLTEYLSWRGFFLINIPIGLLCMAIGSVVVNKDKISSDEKPLDWLGMSLFIIASVGLVTALTESSKFGLDNLWVIASIVASLVIFTIFTWHQLRIKHPLLHFEVLAHPVVAVGNVITFCLQTCLVCAVYYAVWMQNVLGFSALQTGLGYIPQTLPVVVMSTVAGRVASEKGYRLPIVWGLLLSACSLTGLTAAFLAQNYWALFPFILLWAVGASSAFPTTINFTLSKVDSSHKGMASGLNQTLRALASAIGLALFGMILANVYGNHPFVDSLASKTLYTHAFCYAMLLPVTANWIAAILAFFYMREDSHAK